MRTIQRSRTLATFLGLLLVCFRAAADSTRPQLPAEVALNKDAGRRSWVFVTLRIEPGEELPFLVDTGSPVTFLDKSLEPRLGKRLSEGNVFLPGTTQVGGEYPAPDLYLGSTPLATSTNVITCDLKGSFAHWHEPHPPMGILGMDCLRHYCIQLDFETGKLRFLDSQQLDVSTLGKTYPLRFATVHGPSQPILPFLNHLGLCGGITTNSLIDTGMRIDGRIEKGTARGHYWQRFTHLFAPSRAKLRLAECLWDGQTYTRVCVDEAPNGNILGLRFLARHLVTFDFPNQRMYLKQTSIAPLTSGGKP